MTDKRLFVPLASAPFAWFASGRKTWELRKHGRQYTERNLRLGRRVELRRGYNDAAHAIWGTLKEVKRAGGIEAFFQQVPFALVIPEAATEAQAVEQAKRILKIEDGERCELSGFRVEVDAS